ncbi:ABC transporter substrate-binding protein [Phytohabitans flavus]|uniref:ABC transporter substrate-binding protein n=1 Tax=Phytohabitans flavus TaxID=1076124 RepID=A0A6F8XTU1_9ACTN|nr:extracellular solute-binding protein [Phytohabitans flavus]BCB77158.1 ABC transporter substrate-binding protein [Phytohabitans flavus]
MINLSHRSTYKSHSRRWRIVVAAAAVVPLLLAGCSSSEPEEDVPAGEIGGTLNYWVPLDTVDDATVADYTRLYVDPFKKQYPNVEFKLSPQNNEGLTQKTQTALAAGQAPDIIPLNSTLAIPFAEAGYLADLGKLAEDEGWKDKIFPWAMDMGVIDGKLVVMPVSYETLVLFYNKTLFEKNGWKPPTDRASLEALAGQMQAAGIVPFANANADYAGATEHVLSCFFNQVAGPGKIYDALTGKIPFTDQAFVDTVDLMVDYFKRGYFQGGVKQYFSTPDTQKMAKLANGGTGMFVSGSWEIGGMNEYFEKSGNEWDWAPLPPLAPGVPSDVFPLAVGDAVAVNAASKNASAAKAYLKWKFTDTEANWQAIKDFGDLPLPVKFDASAAPEGTDPGFLTQYTALSDASLKKQVGYVTWSSFGSAADSYILENEDRLLTGDLSTRDFLEGMNKAFQKDREEGLIPPVFETAAR